MNEVELEKVLVEWGLQGTRLRPGNHTLASRFLFALKQRSICGTRAVSYHGAPVPRLA